MIRVSDRIQSLKNQISEIEAHLALIEERKSQYVSQTAIPLDLIRDEQRLRDKVEKLQTELQTLPGNVSLEKREVTKLKRASMSKIGIPLILVIAIIFFVSTYLRDKANSGERTLSYWASAQKYKDRKKDGEPIRLLGSEMYFNTGDELQFFITSSDNGHLYILSEETKNGSPLYQLIFPTPTVNNLLSQVQADKEVATSGGYFDENIGDEKIWIIWSANPLGGLETEIQKWKNETYLGEIKDSALLTFIETLLEQNSKSNITVEQDVANKRMIVKGKGDIIIRRLDLFHR